MIFDTSKVYVLIAAHDEVTYVDGPLLPISNKAAAAASAWLPLLYDSIVLALTIRCTCSHVTYPTVGRTMRMLLQEGILYYRCVSMTCLFLNAGLIEHGSVIFSVTFGLTLMIALAPEGLKNLLAQ